MGLFSSIGKIIGKVASPIMDIVGIGSGILGGYSAYKSGKAAESAAEATERSSEWQARLANEQWQRYLDTFAPLEDQIVKEAGAPVEIEKEPGFARMMAAINRGYSDVAANTRRTMAGRYPSGSGLETLPQQDIEMERTRTKAGAISDFATDAEKRRFSQMLQAANIGRSLPATSVAAGGSAGFQSANLAKMYGNASAQTWGALGNTAGNLMQMYLMSKAGKTPVYPGAGTYGVTPSADARWSTWH